MARHLLNRILPALAAWLCIAGAPLHAEQPVPADRIVAVVNDEVITLGELQIRLVQVQRQLQQQRTPLPPKEVLERQLLERMIADKVQIQFAREAGLKIDDVQLDRALTRIAENNRMSLSEFRTAIERDGIAWPKFREEIRSEMLIARIRERETEARATVSEAEIDNYLASADRSAAKEEFMVSHVLVRVPEQVNPDQLARLRARAEDALAQIRLGTDFGQVAATYSDAPDGLTGGSLGWRTLDRLPGLFADAVSKLQPGEVAPILRSPAGFHILKLIQRRGGSLSGQKIQQTQVRHILIKTGELVSQDEAKRRLVALKERLDNGADFAELARLHSNDLSASKGGDLGWLYPGDTVPEFERAMNALKPGDVSEPVQSPFGWHLIQVQDRRVQDMSEERQRQVARQALRERKAEEAYEEWLRQLRDRAYVEYRLEEK
ncbi:MAG TPA: peptidylprolyl isomerase [Rhodocyclaceae bacterium]|nr:peptidylprolyl isomerase [Rhodocyclaceae bacterium]